MDIHAIYAVSCFPQGTTEEGPCEFQFSGVESPVIILHNLTEVSLLCTGRHYRPSGTCITFFESALSIELSRLDPRAWPLPNAQVGSLRGALLVILARVLLVGRLLLAVGGAPITVCSV